MPLIGLSHPRAVTRIPDPVHEVVELTLFDRDIVDERAFQRLHFVLQQSVNFVSFPANKNTRFPHSIGTAHLSGRLFAKALSNASPPDLLDFVQTGGRLIDALLDVLRPPAGGLGSGADDAPSSRVEGYLKAHRATISGMSGFQHSPLSDPKPSKGSEVVGRIDTEDAVGAYNASFVVDTLWQAIRIYALTHDIGHLPMSHAFEEAIDHATDGMTEYVPPTEEAAETDAAGTETAVDGGTDFGELVDQNRRNFSGLADQESEEKNFLLMMEKMFDLDKQAIQQYVLRKPLHEVRGFAILNRLLAKPTSIPVSFERYSKTSKEEIERYSRLIHNLALCLIYSAAAMRGREDNAAPDWASFLFGMRQLVDGTVDGDRLDYTRRDCHEAGARFGDFDIESIVRNALLIRKVASAEDEEVPSSKGALPKSKFAFGYGPKAVHGIEQFFEARYQSYKYLVHHRTASRSNIAVETLIEKMFILAALHPKNAVAGAMERYGYVKLGGSNGSISELLPVAKGEEIERIDDSNLRTLLHEVRVASGDKAQAAASGSERRLLAEIETLCDVVLYRRLDHIITLHKHHTPDSLLEAELPMKDRNERAAFLTSLSANVGEVFTRLRRDHVNSARGGRPPLTFMHETIIPRTYKNDETLLFEQQVWIRNGDRKRLRLGDRRVSHSLHAMAKERNEVNNIRVYVAGRNIKSDEGLQEEAKGIFRKALQDQMKIWATDARDAGGATGDRTSGEPHVH